MKELLQVEIDSELLQTLYCYAEESDLPLGDCVEYLLRSGLRSPLWLD